MKITILDNQIGLIKRKGILKPLYPGTHYTYSKNLNIINSRKSLQEQSITLSEYSFPKSLFSHLDELNVKDGEFVIRLINGVVSGVYKVGVHYFVKTNEPVELKVYTKDDIDLSFMSDEMLRILDSYNIIDRFVVNPSQIAKLYINGTKAKLLQPGVYSFNSLNNTFEIYKLNIGMQLVQPNNQELLTKDKVNLRINFFATYRVANIDYIFDKYFDNHSDILYTTVQMALRNVIASITLDELLSSKDEISKQILEYLYTKQDDLGVEFFEAGIKDVILPGEIKDILNTVIIAEKKAQANIITRREETASTRSLLNTAKLMEDNKILYRLKELEIIERIFSKVGNVNLSNSNVLESIEKLISKKD